MRSNHATGWIVSLRNWRSSTWAKARPTMPSRQAAHSHTSRRWMTLSNARRLPSARGARAGTATAADDVESDMDLLRCLLSAATLAQDPPHAVEGRLVVERADHLVGHLLPELDVLRHL